MGEARRLPPAVRKVFWDTDVSTLDWERDREQIIGRVLAAGTWDAVSWLRREAGDPALRVWIERHEGRGLSPQKLRYWQLILGIPSQRVDRWLQDERRQIWDRRAL